MSEYGGLSADCHYGDHRYRTGANCVDCGHFNAGLLRFLAYEKAEREGRAHFGHYHRTVERKKTCRRKPDAEWVEAYGTAETAGLA